MIAPVPRLHAVTDDTVLALTDLDARASRLAAAGDIAFQVRGHVSVRRLIAIAERLRSTGRPVLLNDRADATRHAGAVGVHLPANGLPSQLARRLLGPDAIIGRSTHDPVEARHAYEDGADYVFLGPIWPTASHPERPPLGVEAIAAALPARVVAIGGITPDRARQCADAGAYGAAAITALWHAVDPTAAARQILLSFD